MPSSTFGLDTDRLAEIFKETIKHPQCPFCESEDWALPLPPGSIGVALPWAVGQEYAMVGMQTVMLYCKNCGFVRMHALEALDGVLVETDVIEVGPGKGSQV